MQARRAVTDAASTIAALEHAAWALAAVAKLCGSGAVEADTVRLISDDDTAAARALAWVGLPTDVGDGYEPAPGMAELMRLVPATILARATISVLRQIATAAPFIPRAAFHDGLANIHAALRPGGWIVVAAGRLDGDDLAVSVTRWQTLLAGGTPLTATDVHTVLTTTGFINIAPIATPAGAPALYCGQRPPAGRP